jgi:adenosine deaminase
VKTLLNKGVIATINSDDPAYFGGYLNENYWQVYNHLHLTKEELAQLAKNSFEYSFLSPAEKEKFITKIEAL